MRPRSKTICLGLATNFILLRTLSLFAAEIQVASPSKICAFLLELNPATHPDPDSFKKRLLQFKHKVELQTGVNVGTAVSSDTVSYRLKRPVQASWLYPGKMLEASPAGQVLARLNRAIKSSSAQYYYWDNEDLLQWSKMLTYLKDETLQSENFERIKAIEKWVNLPDGISTTIGWISGIASLAVSVALSQNTWSHVILPAVIGRAAYHLGSIRKGMIIPPPYDLSDRIFTLRQNEDWFVGLTHLGVSYEILFSSEKGHQRLELLVEKTVDFSI